MRKKKRKLGSEHGSQYNVLGGENQEKMGIGRYRVVEKKTASASQRRSSMPDGKNGEVKRTFSDI